MAWNVQIIADSINKDDNRITSFLLTYPRFIHSELMTHRVFSRNAASSRAIPISKVMEQVENDPAMPVRWGKNGKGMQDHGHFTDVADIKECEFYWKQAGNAAIAAAWSLSEKGVHKQIANRIMEPFMWMTTLVTATEWENFFALRVHKDAQPEFQYLAYHMLKEYLDNSPVLKLWGEWHIPFGDRMPEGLDDADRIKVAVARAARTSYLTMDGQIDIQKDFDLHDRLAESGHWSPFEHAAMARNFEPTNFKNRYGNFVGWKQYRQFFGERENRKCDLRKLLVDYEASIPPQMLAQSVSP